MIYVWLSLVALIFGVLGFLLRAFYFGRQQYVGDDVTRLLESLNRKLAVRERIYADAQEEITKTRMLVKSLEAQLEQRDEQMKALQSMAQRQEEEIRLLQRTTASCRPSASAAGASRAPTTMAAPAQAQERVIVPLWKDNLDRILKMLDKLQEETKE